MPEDAAQPAPEPPDDQAMLVDYLASRDVPCPLCGYNLRGLRHDHCPECGQSLRLAVNLVAPVRGAYVVGLVGLACALGFNGLFLLMIVVMIPIMGPGGPPGWVLMYLTASALVSGGLLTAWVQKAVAIQRLKAEVRQGLACACWAVPLISVVLLIIVIANSS